MFVPAPHFFFVRQATAQSQTCKGRLFYSTGIAALLAARAQKLLRRF